MEPLGHAAHRHFVPYSVNCGSPRRLLVPSVKGHLREQPDDKHPQSQTNASEEPADRLTHRQGYGHLLSHLSTLVGPLQPSSS